MKMLRRIYYRICLRETEIRFKDKPSTLALSRRFFGYKLYINGKN